MSERRALILGISGQDGSYLAELLLEKGYEVWGVVRRSPTQHYENLDGVRHRIELMQGDLLDQMTIVEALTWARPHELYNLAATSFVPASWHQPVITAQFTAVGVTSMLEAIRLVAPEVRLYQASSSEVFGATTESPQSETTPFRPTNPYGAAKLYGHFMVAGYRERYGIHASSGFAFNHESPRRPLEFVTRKVTRAAAAIKLGVEQELVLGDLSATRDWGFSPDYVEAMWRMLQQDDPGDYVLATGESRSVRDLVTAAFAAVDLDPEEHLSVDESLVRPPDAVPLVGDPSKAARVLGWRRSTSFESMIGAMVDADLELLRGAAPAPQP
ncbi:MAG: GDP-mannose 4,6-dehydratase [Thermoleophilaceae bacterium]